MTNLDIKLACFGNITVVESYIVSTFDSFICSIHVLLNQQHIFFHTLNPY